MDNEWSSSNNNNELDEYELEWRTVIDPLHYHDHDGQHLRDDDDMKGVHVNNINKNDDIVKNNSESASPQLTSSAATPNDDGTALSLSLSSSSSSPGTLSNTAALTSRDWQTIGIFSSGTVLLLALLMQVSGAGAWRYYLAGGVCAAVSHAIPVPVDVVKTRKQVDPSYCDLTMPVAIRKLVETEGLSALFVGMGPTFWGYFIEGAVKFGVYEILKPWLGRIFVHQWTAFCACAALSGMAAGVMLCPMEALRIRLVAEPAYAAQGWVRGGLRMIHTEGWRGLFRGLTPMLYKQVPYTITKNVSFDFLTKFMYTSSSSWWRTAAVAAAATGGGGGAATTKSALKVAIPFVAATMASVLSCLSSQPGDMLLSLVSAHEGERRRTRDVIAQIYNSDRGLRGFMVGVKTRLLHVGLIVTVQLLIYDFVKRLFGIAATGSV